MRPSKANFFIFLPPYFSEQITVSWLVAPLAPPQTMAPMWACGFIAANSSHPHDSERVFPWNQSREPLTSPVSSLFLFSPPSGVVENTHSLQAREALSNLSLEKAHQDGG
jgi:hypothetical protein